MEWTDEHMKVLEAAADLYIQRNYEDIVSKNPEMSDLTKAVCLAKLKKEKPLIIREIKVDYQETRQEKIEQLLEQKRDGVSKPKKENGLLESIGGVLISLLFIALLAYLTFFGWSIVAGLFSKLFGG